MTISNDLFKAVLAMDAYNRGDSPKIDGLDGNDSKIGDARITLQSDRPIESVLGFSATAYSWQGHPVISYRGTDNITSDAATGWTTGGGGFESPQALMAAQFYRTVMAQNLYTDPYLANVEFTGHSLGGGLAGLMASLYHKPAVIFDNMSFELAAGYAFGSSFPDNIAAYSQTARDAYYFNGAEPITPDGSQITAFATTGEVLAASRGFQDTDVHYFDSHGGFRSPLDLHSQALLVNLMYADENHHTEWAANGKEFIDALFNDQLAQKISNNSTDDADKMLTRVAYSAVDTGTNDTAARPFGDTAIKAMFNDADDLGHVLGAANVSDVIVDNAKALSEIFVQFAGQLAFKHVLESSSPLAATAANNGVLALSPDGSTLSVDFSASLWNLGGGVSTSSIGRTDLLEHLFAQAGEDSISSYFSHPETIKMATTDTAVTTTLDNASWWTYQVFAGGNGDDSITASSSLCCIFGGGGNDTIAGISHDIWDVTLLVGGEGNDLITNAIFRDRCYGGAGSDTLSGSGGNLYGGEGNDLLILNGDWFDADAAHYLNGGSGNDTLVSAGESGFHSTSSHLEGGEGKDFYELYTTGFTEILGGAGNIDRHDQIAIDGQLFFGEAQDNFSDLGLGEFTLNGFDIQYDAGLSGTLHIGDRITLYGWENGDYGITLENAPPPAPFKAFSFGDPHLVTFDGYGYDFQAVGEFTLMDFSDSGFTVQVRQEPWNNSDSVSVNTAIAAQLGDQVVGFYAYNDSGFFVGDTAVSLNSGDSIAVGNGTVSRNGTEYTVLSDSGGGFMVSVNPGSSLNITPLVSFAQAAHVSGLLGNADGDPSNDLTLADGTVLGDHVAESVLYGAYADSWRVTDATSLFLYGPGENTGTFTDRNFPTHSLTLEDIAADVRAQAEQMALNAGISSDSPLFNSVVLDIALTGNPGFAQNLPQLDAGQSITPVTVQHAPDTVDDQAETSQGQAVLIPVLANDSDKEGDPLALGNVEAPANGTAIAQDNAVLYTPNAGFSGTDGFLYSVSDGQGNTSIGHVAVNVIMDQESGQVISGTENSDSLFGSAGDDTISGLEGNDRLFGDTGNDFISGDEGRDRIEGNDGNDTVDGGRGNDTIRGGDGNDSLFGGSGDDTVYGGNGDDYIDGGNSADMLRGDDGNDTLLGGSSTDSLRGGNGNDIGDGGSGADDLRMGEGDDTLIGGTGNDKLYGEGGADTFVFDLDAFNADDRIKDFSISDGDKIKLEGILIGFTPSTDNISDYVKFADSGTHTNLSVDRDGLDGAYTSERIAYLDHITGLDAQTLYEGGNLVVA